MPLPWCDVSISAQTPGLPTERWQHQDTPHGMAKGISRMGSATLGELPGNFAGANLTSQTAGFWSSLLFLSRSPPPR